MMLMLMQCKCKNASLTLGCYILSENGPKCNSDDINHYATPRMCYHINGEVPPKEAPKLTLPDQSPHSRTIYL